MFIQTEATPNPLTLKFMPGKPVMDGQVLEITSKEAAQQVPLAEELFQINGVAGIFFGKDFISVSKTEDADWMVLKPQVLGAIMEYYMTHDQLIIRENNTPTSNLDEEDDEIVREIKALLETRIRPAVAQDGGDIVFSHFTQGIVYLQMKGACSGCPSSSVTLKNGIENMLRHYIPEVSEVRAI
jgi:Fe-S cluster biogenesis protein NfuA